jgi:hypothetical protein
MTRAALEAADIFRSHGPAWRQANAAHLSVGQLKAMAAIQACRTALVCRRWATPRCYEPGSAWLFAFWKAAPVPNSREKEAGILLSCIIAGSLGVEFRTKRGCPLKLRNRRRIWGLLVYKCK